MIVHDHPSPIPPGRAVIVGGSGFVGSSLVAHLTGLGIPTLPLSSADIDLRTPACIVDLQRIVQADDTLVIVSAITPDKGRDIRTLMSNLTMGEHLSTFLEAKRCAHVVYISSDAVYDDAANPVRETSCCNPATFHGLMHLARERMFAYAAQKSASPFLILRPCAVYGPGDTHNGYGPNRFVRAAKREHKITLFGNGEEKRDHVYIEDLSSLTALCLLHRSRGILNVATGAAVSFLAVAEMVRDLCGVPVQIECLPRATAITHRHFDPVETIQAFPSFRFQTLQRGLSTTLAAI